MSLKQLLEIKEKQTKSAYQIYHNASTQFNSSKGRHDQLCGYRLDYMQQMENLGQTGGTLGQLRNRIEFINSLDTALTQLDMQLAQLAKQRQHLELLYNKAKIDEDAVKKLIERKQSLEDMKIRRKEQKDSDEYAQKQWYNKQSTAKAKTPIEYSD